MIGEATPSAPAAQSEAANRTAAAATNGSTHIVARGETLTSIAKMYSVTVSDLQKWNHIDDGRKLQMGQTIVVAAPSPAPSATSGE
jgi:LysM repeat protein